MAPPNGPPQKINLIKEKLEKNTFYFKPIFTGRHEKQAR